MAEIAGLKLIVPSSVAAASGTASVSASGKVTFTTATTVNVNGCFDSTYDNYLIVVQSTISASTDFEYRLRASGSDATGSNYTRQVLSADNTSIFGVRQSSQSTGRTTFFGSTLRNGLHLYLYGPALAQPTATRGVGASSLSSARFYDWAVTHSLSTSYDGISFFGESGQSLTGSLTIYGLSQ